MRGAKSLTRGFVVPKGRPRYVKGSWPTWHPKTAARRWIFYFGTLRCIRHDLWKLTLRPFDEAKLSRSAFRQKSCLASACRNSSVSPTYCSIGKLSTSLFGMDKPKRSCLFSLLTMLWSKSATSTKRRGERGSPCLTHLLQWTSFHGIPLRRIDEVPDDRMSCIQWHHCSGKPFASRISIMAECPIIWNAFSKYNLRRMISLFELWHWYKY